MPNNNDRTFILVEVSDNEPARALVENLMDEMNGTVLDMAIADGAAIDELGKPSINWVDNT